ncbi:unnamed protein product [Prunus armeniaca]
MHTKSKTMLEEVSFGLRVGIKIWQKCNAGRCTVQGSAARSTCKAHHRLAHSMSTGHSRMLADVLMRISVGGSGGGYMIVVACPKLWGRFLRSKNRPQGIMG